MFSYFKDKLNKYLEDVVNAQSKDDQLRKFDPICSLLTYSQFSNDEGDYGQSLELGLSMLAFHPKGNLRLSLSMI